MAVGGLPWILLPLHRLQAHLLRLVLSLLRYWRQILRRLGSYLVQQSEFAPPQRDTAGIIHVSTLVRHSLPCNASLAAFQVRVLSLSVVADVVEIAYQS